MHRVSAFRAVFLASLTGLGLAIPDLLAASADWKTYTLRGLQISSPFPLEKTADSLYGEPPAGVGSIRVEVYPQPDGKFALKDALRERLGDIAQDTGLKMAGFQSGALADSRLSMKEVPVYKARFGSELAVTVLAFTHERTVYRITILSEPGQTARAIADEILASVRFSP